MSTGTIRILFLCAHPQPFLLSGIKKLRENYDTEVMVVHWAVPDISPTQLDGLTPGVRFVEKGSISISSLNERIDEFEPCIIYAAGWMDKDYLRICKRYRKAGKTTVMGMDTQWKGLARQRLHSIMSPFVLRPIFKYAWVPGDVQYTYARKLGFGDANILKYLYAPDTELFKKAYEDALPGKRQYFPKTFLYVGRLVAHKFGPLLSAFNALSEQEKAGWKLIVVGKGPMEQDMAMKQEDIIYKGFRQQDELADVIREAGVFCLLSTEEPWGTVIQEFAAAGMPILASRQCGASHSYVVTGESGYVCDGANEDEIKTAMLKIIDSKPELLLEMGARSMQLAAPDNSDKWAATLMSVA